MKKGFFKKVGATMLAFAVAAATVLAVPSVEAQAATTITLSATTATIEKGNTKAITVDTKKTTKGYTSVKWTTSNAKVATVSNKGVITGVAAGTATITATSTKSAKVKATVEVTVTGTRLANKCYIDNTLALKYKGAVTLTVNNGINTTKLAASKYNWTSSNTKIATVDKNGKVTAKSATGYADITATSKTGKKNSVKVRIYVTKNGAPTSVKVKTNRTELSRVDKQTATGTVTIASGYCTAVKWTSDKPEFATVSAKGVVTPVSAGTAKITVTTVNGKNASFNVIVKNGTVNMTDTKGDYSSKYVIAKKNAIVGLADSYNFKFAREDADDFTFALGREELEADIATLVSKVADCATPETAPADAVMGKINNYTVSQFTVVDGSLLNVVVADTAADTKTITVTASGETHAITVKKVGAAAIDVTAKGKTVHYTNIAFAKTATDAIVSATISNGSKSIDVKATIALNGKKATLINSATGKKIASFVSTDAAYTVDFSEYAYGELLEVLGREDKRDQVSVFTNYDPAE